MSTESALEQQFAAALSMLEAAVDACPPALWEGAHHNPFWQLAYHVLYYTHLYLSSSPEQKQPWRLQRGNYHQLGESGNADDNAAGDARVPYTRAEITDYLRFVRGRIAAGLATPAMTAASGFDWIPFQRLELHLYNLRHLAHHTGQLIDRIRNAGDGSVQWRGRAPQATD